MDGKPARGRGRRAAPAPHAPEARRGGPERRSSLTRASERNVQAKAFPNARIPSRSVTIFIRARWPKRGRRLTRRLDRPRRASRWVWQKDDTGRVLGLVMGFDGLHDMGDHGATMGRAWGEHVGRSGRRRHAHPYGSKLDASWMKVEPTAGERLAENLKPVGRLYSAASAMRADLAGAGGGRRSRSPSRRVPLARVIEGWVGPRAPCLPRPFFNVVLGHDP